MARSLGTHTKCFTVNASGVAAGFLLTAVPNWTGRLPVAGWRLALLFSLWCLGRIAFLAIGIIGVFPAILIDSVFLPCLLAVMAARGERTDRYFARRGPKQSRDLQRPSDARDGALGFA